MFDAVLSTAKWTLSSTAGEGENGYLRSESDPTRISRNLKACKSSKSTSEIFVYVFCNKYLQVNVKERERTWRKEGKRKEGKKKKEKGCYFLFTEIRMSVLSFFFFFYFARENQEFNF